MKTAALITASGAGARAGGGVPKHYRPVGGKPVLSWVLETFCQHPQIDRVLVVTGRSQDEYLQAALEASQISSVERKKLRTNVYGGETRQETARNGLMALSGENPELVLIHDSARPFVTEKIITDVVNGLETHEAVLPVLPVLDTLKIHKGKTLETLNRDEYVRAQTPQGFKFGRILSLHQKYADTPVTDDTSLAELAGIEVLTVPGDEANFKLTFPTDFKRAELVLYERIRNQGRKRV